MAHKVPDDFSGQLVCAPWFYRQWMLAGNPANFFDEIIRNFGDFVYYRGVFNFYLINHPALVKQILQETNKSFDKHNVIYDRFRTAFGNGLVVAEGEHWKRQRKLMQPMFVPSAVKQFVGVMVSSASSLVERWESKSSSQTVFDIASDMNHLTLEIAGRALFHDGFSEAAEKISHWTATINQYCAKPPLPIIRSPWFPSRRNRKLKATMRALNEFLSEMIAKRRGTSIENDLLSILLAATHEGTNQRMTDVEIMEEVLGMIIGGHETSSSALTWTWYEIDQNKDVQARLFNEIDEVLGGRTLTLEDIPKLRFTKMIIEESLRLHPPFWFENRNVASDVLLGGVLIPKGSIIAFSRYSLHRHANFWVDPNRFDPQRFEPGNEENTRASCAQVPFGGGPRICIGINFAMLELIAIIAVVSQRYRVVVDSSHRHATAAQLTMTPRFGVKVRLESR